MRIVKSVFAAALLAGAAITPLAQAQVPAAPVAGPALVPPTIALVDMKRVVLESAAGRAIQAQLETERRKIRDQLAKLDEELKNGENELRRQRPVLQQDAFNEQYQAFLRKQADAQRIQQDRQEAFSKGQNDALNVVVDNMKAVVQDMAAERRITLVLSKEVVITMADKNMDITDDVIQRLNTKLPSVTVVIPAPGATAAAGPVAGGPAATAPAPAKATKK
jgi:Skp family chaperone for outer membrane proteins